MAFGSGFLQGLSVVGDYMRKEELMKQRQEDRDREQYGRDLEALINDFGHTRGDMTEEEFRNSNEFAALMKRHANSKVFAKALQAGNKPGRNTKLRDIVQGPDGKNVLIVDTYDDQGRLVSKGRPATVNRDSLEENPNDPIAQFSNADLYDNVMGLMQQSDDYVDMVGVADRYEDSILATIAPQGLAADGTPPVTPVDPGPAPQDATPKDEIVEASTPPTPEQVEEEKAATFEDLSDLEAKQVTLDGLNQEFEAKRQEYVEAGRQYLRDEQSMSMQQRAKAKGALETMKGDLAAMEERIGKVEDVPVEGEVTAHDVGRAIGEAPMDAAKLASKAAWTIYDAFTDNPVANTFKEVLQGIEDGFEGKPEGTPKALEFEEGADEQMKKATPAGSSVEDLLSGKVAPKPKTGAQEKAISRANQSVADTINSGSTLTRKQLKAFLKAQRAQIIHGDITPAQAKANYHAMLAAHKKKAGNYSINIDDNGVVTVFNKETGAYSQSQGAGGTGTGDSFKRNKEIAQIVGKGDKTGRTTAEFLKLADKSTNTMNLFAEQDGYSALMMEAFQYRQAAVAEASEWHDIFTSRADAERMFSSLTPFIAGTSLGVDMGNPDTAEPWIKKMTAANGGDLTERDYQQIAEFAAVLGNPEGKYRLKGRELEETVAQVWADSRAERQGQ